MSGVRLGTRHAVPSQNLMLVISRRKGQCITIGDDVELVITALHRSSVKVGIMAPPGCIVMRGEVRDSIEQANREALESALEDGTSLPGVAQPSRTFGLRTRLLQRQATGGGARQSRDETTKTLPTAQAKPEAAPKAESPDPKPADTAHDDLADSSPASERP
jgi:carbon storage regulator